MSFINLTRKAYVNGGDVNDIRITFENLCEELSDSRYDSGIDAETMVGTLSGIYKYITGTLNGRPLMLPATSLDPDDRHRTMWAEGTKVRTRSRRDSQSSRGSSVTSNGMRVPNLNLNRTNSVASSSVSARYAPVRARFIEDEHDDSNGVRNVDLRSVRNTSTQQSRPPTQDGRKSSFRGEPASAPRASATRSRVIQQDDEEHDLEQIDIKPLSRSSKDNRRTMSVRTTKNRFIEDE